MRKANLKKIVIMVFAIALIASIATFAVLSVPLSETTSDGNGDEFPPC